MKLLRVIILIVAAILGLAVFYSATAQQQNDSVSISLIVVRARLMDRTASFKVSAAAADTMFIRMYYESAGLYYENVGSVRNNNQVFWVMMPAPANLSAKNRRESYKLKARF